MTPTRGGPASARGESGWNAEQIRRYSRHLLLPEVGLAGQGKLRDARVAIVGLGGLGSPVALYLAAAGVGELGLCEFDPVDLSNLQRQILYDTSAVGRPKLAAAAERIRALNPDITVVAHEGALTAENALERLRPYDVVVDGSDNFPTRYLVNDASVLLGRPDVFGSVYRFEGQATVFDARSGPCYRCLYPSAPPPGEVPSCGEAGVLGVLPGLIGILQATEALKLVLGVGEPLVGRMVIYDALSMGFRELKLRKSPDCPVCGPHPSITSLAEAAAACADEPVIGPADAEIGPLELVRLLAGPDPPMLVDVREPGEWTIAHLPNAVLIPRGELPGRLAELARAHGLVLYCKSGNRSRRAAGLLREHGFSNVLNLRGGIDAWAEEIDPSMARY